MNSTHAKSRIVATTLAAAIAGTSAFASLAGTRPAQAEAAPAQAQADAGVWMAASYKVYDHALWKRAHDRSAAVKRGYGWKRCEVFAVDGDRNHVLVMEQFATLERARAFADSSDLRDEMAASGVASNPEIRFLTAVEVASAR